jgi:hypothetical protein
MTDDGSMLYVITVSDQTGPSLNVFSIGPPVPTVLPTTTTVAATPANPLFGSSVTFTATVAPTTPSGTSLTGTVKFYLDGQTTPVVTANLIDGHAGFSTTGLAHGGHSVVAIYSGDANFATSTAAPLDEAVDCSDTITGVRTGSIVIPSGSTCIVGARIHGSVIVATGASADIEGTVVYGTIYSSRANATRICADAVTGNVQVGGATGLTMVGDPGHAGCGPNIIAGTLVLNGNHGGVEAINNYAHRLVASNNDGPGPFPGDVTTISGNWSN